jgi:hypothetical protein
MPAQRGLVDSMKGVIYIERTLAAGVMLAGPCKRL